MPIDFNFWEAAPNDPVSPNYEGCAFDTHEITAVQGFPLVYPECLSDLVASVAQQREGKSELVYEFPMGRGRIRAHPDDLSPSGSEKVYQETPL